MLTKYHVAGFYSEYFIIVRPCDCDIKTCSNNWVFLEHAIIASSLFSEFILIREVLSLA